MHDTRLAFVAYPSKDRYIVTVLRDGLGKAAAKTNAVRYEPWEFNDVAGVPLVSPIIENIANSSFVVADITHLNSNVVYEIGYAIGSRKRVFLIRHTGTRGDKDIANKVGIFDTLGYFEYDDCDSLAHRLTGYIENRPIDFVGEIDHKSPVYVVEPSQKGEAATSMISRLKKAR